MSKPKTAKVLQWGRAIAGADMPVYVVGLALGGFASMGPRHCWRGYTDGREALQHPYELQWGRAIAGADIASSEHFLKP